jgi:hypothetical protein
MTATKPKVRRTYRSFTVEAEVDLRDILDDLEDDDIIEEAQYRNLIVGPKPTGDSKQPTLREDAGEIQNHIMCKRIDRAQADLKKLMALFVPAPLIAAMEALRAGHADIAICELDHFIEPAPSSTATTLPKPFALQPE